MSQEQPSYLGLLGKALGAGLVGFVMSAVAGGIMLVALSFALYAALLPFCSPAAASAGTAAVFAVICAILAIVTPRLITGGKKATPVRASTLNPATLSLGLEIAMALLAGLTEASRRRNESKRDRRR